MNVNYTKVQKRFDSSSNNFEEITLNNCKIQYETVTVN